jgi:hypothetical protein
MISYARLTTVPAVIGGSLVGDANVIRRGQTERNDSGEDVPNVLRRVLDAESMRGDV